MIVGDILTRVVPARSETSILELWPMREKEKQFFVKDDVSFL